MEKATAADTTPASGDAGGPLRHVVQHECGHAAAFWVLGYPFDRITLNGPAGPCVMPVPGGVRMMAGHDFVIKLCGAVADQQARGLRMRGSQITRLILGGEGGDIFEIDDASGQVAVRPSRMPAVQPGGDLHTIAATFASMPRQQGSQEAIRLWRECERFCAELRPAIDALAEAVLARGDVMYPEAVAVADQAMKGKPRPVLADWLR